MSRRVFGRGLWGAFAILMAALLGGGPARAQDAAGRRLVVVAKIAGAIMPPTKEYIARALQRAEREGADGLLIEMDTPGGRGDSMREIVQLFLNAKVPVVVYVTPPGAQAASAGAVIGLGAHVLAMAPGTNIGAAHPVSGSGENIPSDMKAKVVNDMAAFVRTVAEKRGKSVQWAEQIIRQSISNTETEALKAGIADYVVANRADLLRQMNGRKVNTAAGTKTLRTLHAATQEEAPSWVEAFLLFLFNPNVALILGAVAFYGIIAEIQNPGAVLPGVTGCIALVLSLYSLSVLSVNAAGAALLVLALILFAVDLYAPTHGVLTAGGVVAFIVGALMLFKDSEVGVQVSLGVVLTLALLTAGFSVFLAGAALRARRRPPGSGPETLLGKPAEARTAINPTGKVFAEGSFWNAVNVGIEPIQPGDGVLIESRDGLTLKVRRATVPEADPIWKSEK